MFEWMLSTDQKGAVAELAIAKVLRISESVCGLRTPLSGMTSSSICDRDSYAFSASGLVATET